MSASNSACTHSHARKRAAEGGGAARIMAANRVMEALAKEIEQAKSGTHHRQKSEEKRLSALKAERIKHAEHVRALAMESIDKQFEEVRREAEEELNTEKSNLQDKLYQEVLERQKRSSSQDANSIRAMTRQLRQKRGDTTAASSTKPINANKRDMNAKNGAFAMPLRQGDVEEDFEGMVALAEQLSPNLDVGFMGIEVRAKDRMRPVENATKKPTDGTGAKRPRRGDFNLKGKPRAEVSGARITVWYEEEHGGRKMDVPYLGVVSSCDPREGLYVKFEDYPEEMLITNEDDWLWGTHSRKPPESNPPAAAAPTGRGGRRS